MQFIGLPVVASVKKDVFYSALSIGLSVSSITKKFLMNFIEFWEGCGV